MKHLIISYKSRNSLYSFAKILRANGISVNIINTPRSIAISCGLSIKTEFRYFSFVTNLIRQSNLEGFIGVFMHNSSNSHEQYQRLL